MTYIHFPEYFVLGALGAGASEMLKLYELKGKLTTKKYDQAFKSPLFWLVVIGMLCASGFIAWASNESFSMGPWQVVLSGIGARSLIRLPIESVKSNRGMRLGHDEDSDFSPTDLFL